VEYRETLEDALRREVAEETGLEVTVGDALFVSDTIDPSGRRHVVNITFLCDITGGQLSDAPSDPRIDGVDLVDPSELHDIDLRPPMAKSITDFIASGDVQQRYLGSLFTPGHSGR